ncbi:hypothetical protein INP83_01855 [Mucilaginibacter sp. 21P]|uniref:hypothetical protein n=1 Tax=Mucilaginibacter sp. 21P TaxID=2778902 RepID=UPI001C570748|nr:hypothetical protein [Mucilaginibacter sp. 21P]QXV65868.1 hypothetical protein INP83_01855 [Mucilaginibacter sp. 21P]
MKNTFYVCSDQNLEIKRFHICSWEFKTALSLLEFGCEIDSASVNAIPGDNLNLSLYIPLLDKDSKVIDLYKQLSDSENSRFIFNDSINGSDFLDNGTNKAGVVHKFQDREPLCILPIKPPLLSENKIEIHVDLKLYKSHDYGNINVYFRFCINLKDLYISTRKPGINKSTIIYDIKINEKRNIPADQLNEFRLKNFCIIHSCFCFNILPSSYDMTFPDESLKNVRTLEYPSFNHYLGGIIDIPKDELMVVFNKKSTGFTFFSIYTQERIGPAQFAAAVLINIVCGILLFIPSYRKTFKPEISLTAIWNKLPIEIYISFLIVIITVGCFFWPNLIAYTKRVVFDKFKRHGVK